MYPYLFKNLLHTLKISLSTYFLLRQKNNRHNTNFLNQLQYNLSMKSMYPKDRYYFLAWTTILLISQYVLK